MFFSRRNWQKLLKTETTVPRETILWLNLKLLKPLIRLKGDRPFVSQFGAHFNTDPRRASFPTTLLRISTGIETAEERPRTAEGAFTACENRAGVEEGSKEPDTIIPFKTTHTSEKIIILFLITTNLLRAFIINKLLVSRKIKNWHQLIYHSKPKYTPDIII